MFKLSIITINYNNAQGLIKTMNSVFNQTFHEFEYIIIDGASEDGSIEIIKEFSNFPFKRFKWISEPDSGIYNAMNKGIRKATGDYLLFLNSGDEFVSDTVLASSSNLIDSNADICSGILVMVDGEKRTVVSPVSELSLYYCVYNGLTHPNTFIRRSLFDKYGMYNENNKIVSDWEFFLIVGGLHGVNYQAISTPITNFYMDGISSVPNNFVLLEETKLAIERLVPKSILKDLERLHLLENKMNQTDFKNLDSIRKYPVLAIFINFLLRLFSRIIKMKNS